MSRVLVESAAVSVTRVESAWPGSPQLAHCELAPLIVPPLLAFETVKGLV